QAADAAAVLAAHAAVGRDLRYQGARDRLAARVATAVDVRRGQERAHSLDRDGRRRPDGGDRVARRAPRRAPARRSLSSSGGSALLMPVLRTGVVVVALRPDVSGKWAAPVPSLAEQPQSAVERPLRNPSER